MKKLTNLLIIFCCLNTIPSFAQMEMMDLPDAFDQMQFQQNISDEKFDKTIDQIKENSEVVKKQKKAKRKAKKKQPNLEGDILNAPFEFVNLEDTLLVLPYKIESEGYIISQGYYKVKKEKVKSAFFIELIQGHNKIALPMKKTQQEFESDNLIFVKTQKFSDYIKIIYVDMDDTLVNYFKITN